MVLPPLVKYSLTVIVHDCKEVRFWDDKDVEITPSLSVGVTVGVDRQHTAVRNASANVSFESQFTFEVECTAEDFEAQAIDVSVFHSYTFSTALIGRAVLSLGKVYSQSSHFIPKGRLPIRESANPAREHGIVIISAGVFGAGDVVPDISSATAAVVAPKGQQTTTTDSGALSSLMLQYYNVYVSVHRGQDIRPLYLLGNTTLEPFVQVSHNGSVAKTKVARNERSPEWNVQFLIPAVLPTMDGVVRIMLFNGEQSPFLYGVKNVNFEKLTKEAEPPFWLNFYWRHPVEGIGETAQSLWNTASTYAKKQILSENAALPHSITPDHIRRQHEYCARLLVGLHVQHVQVPVPLSIVPSSTAVEPPVQLYTLWADVYEVSSLLGNVGPIQIEFSIGPYCAKTAEMTWRKQSYSWDKAEDGRVKELSIYIPPFSVAWMGYIYICAKSGIRDTKFRRVAYIQIPLIQMAANKNKPIWYSTRALDTEAEAFSVLSAIEFQEASAGVLDRPARLDYALKDYTFRAFVYEAVNVPCARAGEFPSPFLQIELGGRTFVTRHVTNCLHPMYYQSFEGCVSLPDNLDLAPVINVEVWSKRTGFLDSDIHLGSSSFPIKSVPALWDTYPEWLPIESLMEKGTTAESSGHVLCAFELLGSELDTTNEYPFFDDIRPTSFPGFISLFLLGVRMMQPVGLPRVKVCYGRDLEKPENKLWSEFSKAPNSGSGRCYNYMEYMEVALELPKRHVHNAYLEVEVHDEKASMDRPIAIGFIPLTFDLPWLTVEERAIAKSFYEVKTATALLSKAAVISEAAKGRDLAPEQTKKPVPEGGENLVLDDLDTFNISEREDLVYVQMDKSEHKKGAVPGKGDDFYLPAATTREAKPIKKPIVPKLSIGVAEEPGPPSAIGVSARGPTTGRGAATARGLTARGGQAQNVGLTARTLEQVVVPVEPTEVTKPKKTIPKVEEPIESGEGGIVQSVYGYSAEELKFELTQIDEVEDLPEDQKKDEVLFELETEGLGTELPYRTVPLIRSRGPGLPEVVGFLKYNLLIVRGDHIQTEEQTAQYHDFQQQCTAITSLFGLESKKIVARVYLLSLRGLQTPSGSTNPNVFAWVYNGGDTKSDLSGTLPNSINDRDNAIRRGPHPELNRSYQLQMALPDNALITIALFDKGAITDSAIGITHVDVENRWFDEQFQKLMLANSVPIEQRSVVNTDKGTCAGIARLWIDLLNSAQAQSRPVAVLSNTGTEPYQLRVVIWRVRNVPLGEEASISLCVSGSVRGDDDVLNQQYTDVHYNSKNGSAVFRWRFVFDIMLPSKSPRLDLQIYKCGIMGISGAEILTEASYDLASDYTLARRKGKGSQRHIVEKFWLPFYHIQDPGKLFGEVEIGISIVTGKDASSLSVGKGRDAPNRDPYLEHVSENRTYIDWAAIGESVGQVTSAIARTTKWTAYIGIVVLIVGGILLLVILLKK